MWWCGGCVGAVCLVVCVVGLLWYGVWVCRSALSGSCCGVCVGCTCGVVVVGVGGWGGWGGGWWGGGGGAEREREIFFISTVSKNCLFCMFRHK